MRHRERLIVAALLLVGTACSGGEPSAPDDPTPPPPPPPPPPQQVATTMTLHAGDAQVAAAGTTVAVAPAVLVRDQSGQPMAGVTVTFAIDSGGGALQASTALTASTGIATSGGWTLGLGRNALRASSGTLAPVVFKATATGELTLLESTIGAGGGELRVARPGDPLDGLVVRVPDGSFNEPVQVSAKYGDTTGVPVLPGFRHASPPITLGLTSPGMAAAPIELEFKATMATGEVPVVLLFDRLTGAVDVLPTVRLADDRVMAITQHLDASRLPPVTAARVAARPVVAADFIPAVQLIVGAVTEEDLKKDLDTGFRTGVDDWELDHVLVTLHPLFRHAPGLPLAAAWYYQHLKKNRGPLNAKYQRVPGVEWSNPMGFRMAYAASALVNLDAIQAYNEAIDKMAAITASAGVTRDSLVWLHAKSQLHLTQRPQVLLGVDESNPSAPPLALLAYRTMGNAMHTTSGTSRSGPNSPKALTMANARFGVPTWVVKDPAGEKPDEVYQPNAIWTTGQNTGVTDNAMAQLWQAFDAGTVASDQFAPMDLASSDDPIVNDTLFIADDTTWVWVQCASCANGHAPGPKVKPAGKVQTGVLYTEVGGTWGSIGSVRGNGISATEAHDGLRAGMLLTELTPTGATSFNDFREFVVRMRRLTVTPSPLKAAGGSNQTFTASYNRPVPAGATWQWDLGDGRMMTTQVNTLQVQYPAPTGTDPDTFRVKVSLKAGTRLEATGRTMAIITPANRWQLTSFTKGDLTSTLLPGSSKGPPVWEDTPTRTENELRDSLLARPQGATLQLLAANATRPSAWRHPDDVGKLGWMALLATPNVETAYLTFPRGGATMAGLMGATGPSVFAPGQWTFYNNPDFVNQLAKSPSGFTGSGASMAYGTQNNFTLPSQVMRYFEIAATATPTGLSGTITLVRRVQCWEDFNAWPGCVSSGEVRRVYHFTAVPK